VTRAELWDFLRRYEAFRRRHVWWRRFGRWLLASALPERAALERAKLERDLERP
jgi:hypothetical protein